MGLWIIQNLQKQTGYSFAEMADMARSSRYEKTFDVDLPRFLSSSDMRAEVVGELGEGALSDADVFNSVYRSLAQSYARAIADLERALGEKRPALVIAGGGAKNGYLNELTRDLTGKVVRAYPVEATAIGNLKVQMEAAK